MKKNASFAISPTKSKMTIQSALIVLVDVPTLLITLTGHVTEAANQSNLKHL